MSQVKVLIALAALTLIGGCSDATQPDGANQDVRGRVVDIHGRPVSDATVVLQYSTDPPLLTKQARPQTGIRFGLRDEGPVTLWISSFCDADTLRMLVDGVLPAGEHTIVWNCQDDVGRAVPDGVYWYHLVSESGEDRRAITLLRPGYGDFAADAAPAPLAVTDARGRFALGQRCLPFDFEFPASDEPGIPVATYTITRNVRVWAFSADLGAVAATDWVTVDPETGIEVTLLLGP